MLEDKELVKTLQISKATSEEVKEQLDVAVETEARIDATRATYKPVSLRAAILYFVLNDLARVDPMYQFSLAAYVDLFKMSIERSRTDSSMALEERISEINAFHTYEVYAYTCRGLFERHKILLSFQICTKIMGAAGKIPKEELTFFLTGGVVLDRSSQRKCPMDDVISPLEWDNITELDAKIISGLAASFESSKRDWARGACAAILRRRAYRATGTTS